MTDSDSLIARLEKNSILGAISTDERPGDEYPKSGHPSLQTTDRPPTELNDLYDVLDRVKERSERNKSKQDTLAAYRRKYEESYTFYATESNKWDPVSYDSWAWSLKHLVIDHILQVQRLLPSLSASQVHLFSTQGKAISSASASNNAKAALLQFIPELLMKHTCVIDETTIKDDLDKHALDTHPAKYALQSKAPTNSGRASAQETISVFKESTLSQLKKLSSIISHEVERLILRLMPKQEDAPIFRRLLQHRIAYVDSQYRIADVSLRKPYNAEMSLEFLKKTCTGSNKRMSIITMFALLSMERKKDQDVYAWSTSFKPLLRKLARYLGQDKLDGDLMSTIYFQPFIGQITSKELTTLNSGGFLIDDGAEDHSKYDAEDGEDGEEDEGGKDKGDSEDKSESKFVPPFDITALEEYCSRNATQFPRVFHMDQRASDYMRESKRGYELISPSLRSPSGTKRKASVLHADAEEDHQDILFADSKRQATSSRRPDPHGRSGRPDRRVNRKRHFRVRPRQAPGYFMDYKGDSRQQHHKGKGKDKGKGRGKGKGKKGKDRERDRGRASSGYTRQANNRYFDRSQKPPHKDHKPAFPPRNDGLCWYCNKPGHTRRNCPELVRLQNNNTFKTSLAAIPKNLHSDVLTIACGVRNPYCTECCRPDCSLTLTPEDDNATCSFPPSDSFTEAKSCFYSDQSLIDTVIRLKSDIRDVLHADDHNNDDRSHDYGDWQSSGYDRWQTHEDHDWQEPSSEHPQSHDDHQHESSDLHEYPDDADDTQDGDVCLAYEDEYPNSVLR